MTEIVLELDENQRFLIEDPDGVSVIMERWISQEDEKFRWC
ncbi:hypothetical protein [Brevibacillus sp. MER 51]|nr:hypothetical protein [Brevibacillus sp. MER 51]